MGQDDRAGAGGLHGGEDVQQEGEVAVLVWRHRRGRSGRNGCRWSGRSPGLGREGRVGDDEVEGLESVSDAMNCGSPMTSPCAISASSRPCMIMFILARPRVVMSIS